MERVSIAELKPELPALESKQIRAVVTLIWTYSSSARQFALLLGDPDFRLRRRKGQVRVRFRGSSARAIASTGVGIGDEVVLSLRGVKFVTDSSVNTPGKSIDWELEYGQTLCSQIIRNGEALASLDLTDAAPTPAPGSPVRAAPRGPVHSHEWSSPAFLKRIRLSDGPIFEAGHDPFVDDIEDGHAKKRRRKSYKDWNNWTYSVRIPSPEKEDVDMEQDEELQGSPIRPTRLPATPVSPPKLQLVSVANSPLEHDTESVDTEDADGYRKDPAGDAVVDNASKEALPEYNEVEEMVERDEDHYDLYAKPDENQSTHLRYAVDADANVEGDTEPNTEEEDESAEARDIQRTDAVTSGPDKLGEEALETTSIEVVEVSSDDSSSEAAADDTIISTAANSAVGIEVEEADDTYISTEENSVAEVEADEADTIISMEDNSAVEIGVDEEADHELAKAVQNQRMRERSGTHDDPIVLDDAPHIVMPPPTLPFLQTDFDTSVPGMLTPIGKEPSSPNLRPLDSSTLPMPSPFPGEQEGTVSSYLDYSSSSQQLHQQYFPAEAEQDHPDMEADYVIESSFYGSVSSSHTPAVNPTHESAFTDVRFTFGMDGSIFSRPKTPSDKETPQGAAPIPDEPAHAIENAGPVKSRQSSPGRIGQATAHYIDHSEGLDDAALFLLSSPPDSKTSQQQTTAQAVALSSSSEAGEAVHEQLNVGADDQGSDNDIRRSQDDRVEGIQSEVSDPAQELVAGAEQEGFTEPTLEDDYTGDDHYNSKDDIAEDHRTGDHHVSDDHITDDHIADDHITDYHVEDDRLRDDHVGDSNTRDDLTEDDKRFRASKDNLTTVPTTQASTTITEVIDLGSPSEESYADEEMEDVNRMDEEDEHIDELSHGNERSFAQRNVEERPEDTIDVAADPMKDGISSANLQQRDFTGPSFDQVEQIDLEISDHAMVESGMYMDLGTPNDAVPGPSPIEQNIKIESIEEPFLSFTRESDATYQQDDEDSAPESTPELLIAVPEEGHKMGEMHLVSVPATGPARNTRSKTKTSLSPEKEAISPSWTARSQKKSSLAPLSPSVPPPRSTISSSQDIIPSSSYMPRSQSQFLSPTKITATSVTRVSPRKLSARTTASLEPSQQSSVADGEAFDSDDYDFPYTNFYPSQELGTLQSKFAGVPYVRDSEEGSEHSEQSLSTVQYSDDWNDGMGAYTNFSDPPDHERQVRELRSTPRKTHPASHGPSPVTPTRKTGPYVVISHKKTPAQQLSSSVSETLVSPAKPLRSMTPIEVASSSPRRSERTRKDILDLPRDEIMSDKRTMNKSTGAGEVPYPVLPVADEDDQGRSSSPVSTRLDTVTDLNKQTVKSPRTETTQVVFGNQQSLINSNIPITPDATQKSFALSQPSFSAVQEQSLPMSPQLTQSTSAALRSFKSNEPEIGSLAAEALVKPSSIRRSTPRRNVTATDVASPSVSPSVHSEDEDDLVPTKADPPSIGLSTPIAYYTPLKDLPYFLNRSSTFYSAGSPDVLALVTTANTPPTRATKGPKHHTTTLHITDLSTYPAQTTVQVFRAYATALPVAAAGDVVLLRAFSVRSLNRSACLVSADESAWCVWRYGKSLWGRKKGAFGEVKAREEVKGPVVERGEGEWSEVERLRGWYIGTVKGELEKKVIGTRSQDGERAEMVEGEAAD